MNSHRRDSHRKRALLPTLAAAALLVPLTAGAYGSGDKEAATSKAKTEDTKPLLTEEARDTANDIRIHVALETKFAQSDQLSALAISTDVMHGVVHLDGRVDTEAKKELATQLAKSVEGVQGVRNDLKVTGGEPGMLEKMQDTAADAALTTRVKTRLLASSNTSGLAIDVSTRDDVVVLAGTVGSETERELAELIAANTSGVADVRNELRVSNN